MKPAFRTLPPRPQRAPPVYWACGHGGRCSGRANGTKRPTSALKGSSGIRGFFIIFRGSSIGFVVLKKKAFVSRFRVHLRGFVSLSCQRFFRDISSISIDVWVSRAGKKTGCRRRNVINQDLGAEEQKIHRCHHRWGNYHTKQLPQPLFNPFLGVSATPLAGTATHREGGRVSASSRTGPDIPLPPAMTPSLAEIFRESNLWAQSKPERGGLSTTNKLLQIVDLTDGPIDD